MILINLGATTVTSTATGSLAGLMASGHKLSLEMAWRSTLGPLDIRAFRVALSRIYIVDHTH